MTKNNFEKKNKNSSINITAEASGNINGENISSLSTNSSTNLETNSNSSLNVNSDVKDISTMTINNIENNKFLPLKTSKNFTKHLNSNASAILDSINNSNNANLSSRRNIHSSSSSSSTQSAGRQLLAKSISAKQSISLFKNRRSSNDNMDSQPRSKLLSDDNNNNNNTKSSSQSSSGVHDLWGRFKRHSTLIPDIPENSNSQSFTNDSSKKRNFLNEYNTDNNTASNANNNNESSGSLKRNQNKSEKTEKIDKKLHRHSKKRSISSSAAFQRIDISNSSADLNKSRSASMYRSASEDNEKSVRSSSSFRASILMAAGLSGGSNNSTSFQNNGINIASTNSLNANNSFTTSSSAASLSSSLPTHKSLTSSVSKRASMLFSNHDLADVSFTSDDSTSSMDFLSKSLDSSDTTSSYSSRKYRDSQFTSVTTNFIPFELDPLLEKAPVIKDGWLNFPLNRDLNDLSNLDWRLVRAQIRHNKLLLFNPPPDFGIKCFEISKQEKKQFSPISPSNFTYDSPPTSTVNTNFSPITTQSESTSNILKDSNSKNSDTPLIPAQILTPGLETISPTTNSPVVFTPEKGYTFSNENDLIYNENGIIVGGTLEGITRYIMDSNCSEVYARGIIIIIILWADFNRFLQLFYLESANIFKSDIEDKLKRALFNRCVFVITTICNCLPSVLLFKSFFDQIQKLLELLKSSELKLKPILTDNLKTEDNQDANKNSTNSKINNDNRNVNKLLSQNLSKMVQDKISLLDELLNPTHFASSTYANDSKESKLIIARLESCITPTGFPAQSFVNIDVSVLAEQIHYFHLNFLNTLSPTKDISLFFSIPNYHFGNKHPLLFTSTTKTANRLHFLARTIVFHLFSGFGLSSALLRGIVLSHWIKIGNALKLRGDMSGWIAIVTVVCSSSVLRLTETWANVSLELRNSVSSDWAPVMYDIERRRLNYSRHSKQKIFQNSKVSSRKSSDSVSCHVLAPNSIGTTIHPGDAVPYFGDLCVEYVPNSSILQCEKQVARIQSALNRWVRFKNSVESGIDGQKDAHSSNDSEIKNENNLKQSSGTSKLQKRNLKPISLVQQCLYHLHTQTYAVGPNGSPLQPEPTTQELFTMSLKTEPPNRNAELYRKYYYFQRTPLTNGSYLPLIFVNVIPSYNLFSRADLLAAAGIEGLKSDNQKQIIAHGNKKSKGKKTAINESSNINKEGASYIPINPEVNRTLRRSASFPPPARNFTTGHLELDLTSHNRIAAFTSPRNQLMRHIRDVLNVGAVIYTLSPYDDLTLKSFPFDEPSTNGRTNNYRRTSRPTSSVFESAPKRASIGSRRLSSQITNDDEISYIPSGPKHSRSQSYQLSQNVTPSSKTHFKANSIAASIDILQSFVSSNLVVKSGTLNRLIDLLVLGIDFFMSHIVRTGGGSDNSIRGATSSSLNARMDMDVYTATFFTTYRRFCSPTALMSSLKKRFLCSVSAAISLQKFNNDGFIERDVLLPNWSLQLNSSSEEVDWKIVAKIQIGVMEAMYIWITQFFFDFASDYSLSDQFIEMLKIFDDEVINWKENRLGALHELSAEKDSLSLCVDSIEGFALKLRKKFIKSSYKPINVSPILPKPPTSNLANISFPSYLFTYNNSEYLCTNDVKILTGFTIKMDSIASKLYSLISVQNWINSFEVLELQSTRLLGFFSFSSNYSGSGVRHQNSGSSLVSPTISPSNSHQSPVDVENVVIQDIYTMLGSLYRDGPEDLVINQFPKIIQELFRLHANLVTWFTFQIAYPGVPFSERVQRIILLLKLLSISRHKMDNLNLFKHDTETISSTNPISTDIGGIPSSRSSFFQRSVPDEENPVCASIPSFLESAISSALISPESRQYTAAWRNAVQTLNKDPKNLSNLLDVIPDYFSLFEQTKTNQINVKKSSNSSNPSDKCLSICVGWIFERMLEITCYVPNMSINNTKQINFDKQRYIYNLVTNMVELKDSINSNEQNASPSIPDLNDEANENFAKAFLTLAPETLELNQKQVKEAAYKENKLHKSVGMRIFSNLVKEEFTKRKRDLEQYNNLKLQIPEQDSTDSAKTGKLPNDSVSNFSQGSINSASVTLANSRKNSIEAMDFSTGMKSFPSYMSLSSINSSSVQGQSQPNPNYIQLSHQSSFPDRRDRNYGRLKLGGFLNRAVRPLSFMRGAGLAPNSMFGHENESYYGKMKIIGSNELPKISSLDPITISSAHKPGGYYLVAEIPLINARINYPMVTRQQCIWNICSIDGQEYSFQAPSESQAEEWIHECCSNRVEESLLDSRLRGLGISDINENQPKTAESRLVFGVSLKSLYERTLKPVPEVVEILLREIESRGLDEIGIYRVPGSQVSVNALRQAFDSGSLVNMEDDQWFDINTVAGVFKLFLRQLPEPILTFKLYRSFIKAGGTPEMKPNKKTRQLSNVSKLVHELPEENFYLLRRIAAHLSRVAARSETNRMNSINLSIVFSMSFLLNEEKSMNDLSAMQNLIKLFIENLNEIFIN